MSTAEKKLKSNRAQKHVKPELLINNSETNNIHQQLDYCYLELLLQCVIIQCVTKKVGHLYLRQFC